MKQFKKSVLIKILCLTFIVSNVFAQNAELITQNNTSLSLEPFGIK